MLPGLLCTQPLGLAISIAHSSTAIECSDSHRSSGIDDDVVSVAAATADGVNYSPLTTNGVSLFYSTSWEAESQP